MTTSSFFDAMLLFVLVMQFRTQSCPRPLEPYSGLKGDRGRRPRAQEGAIMPVRTGGATMPVCRCTYKRGY